MQAINRIQNAMINANAASILGAMVVNSASAHRAYPSYVPCDMRPVSKCLGKRPSSITVDTVTLVDSVTELTLRERGRVTGGPVGRMWRTETPHNLMPATLWATFVLNRNLCG